MRRRNEPKAVDPQRENEFARQASAITSYHFPSGRTEPEELARHLGISFRYAALIDDIDGLILHHAGRFFILCNTRLAPRHSPRTRFTFCHELSHALIPAHAEALRSGAWPVIYCRTQGRSTLMEELEADSFAGQLLMPEGAFRSQVGGAFPSLTRIAEWAEFFGSSVTATAYRALRLEFFRAPAAVLRWDHAGRLLSRKISDYTFLKDEEFWQLASVPPRGSITARAISALMIGTFEEAIPAHAWFTGLSPEFPPHQITLREEVKSLGDYGFITLLFAHALKS